jgi:hypothetical protein
VIVGFIEAKINPLEKDLPVIYVTSVLFRFDRFERQLVSLEFKGAHLAALETVPSSYNHKP